MNTGSPPISITSASAGARSGSGAVTPKQTPLILSTSSSRPVKVMTGCSASGSAPALVAGSSIRTPCAPLAWATSRPAYGAPGAASHSTRPGSTSSGTVISTRSASASTCAGSVSRARAQLPRPGCLDACEAAEAPVISWPALARARPSAIPARPGPMTPTRRRAGCSLAPVSTCTGQPPYQPNALTRIARGQGLRAPGGERGSPREPKGAAVPGLRSEAVCAERRGKASATSARRRTGEILPDQLLASVLWWIALALALRSFFEPVMVSYYPWPPMAVALIPAATLGWRRLLAGGVLGGALTGAAQGPPHDSWIWWPPIVPGLIALLVISWPRPAALMPRRSVKADALPAARAT